MTQAGKAVISADGHEDEREAPDERCGTFCSNTPTRTFEDHKGRTRRVCDECYHASCGLCGDAIAKDENRALRICEACQNGSSAVDAPDSEVDQPEPESTEAEKTTSTGTAQTTLGVENH